MTKGIPDSASHKHDLSRLHLQETSILHVMICPCDCAAVRKIRTRKANRDHHYYVSVTSHLSFCSSVSVLIKFRLGGRERSGIVTPPCLYS